MTVAIILIVLAVLCRVLPTMDLSLSNLSPFTAIAFCGAVYVRKPWFWALSFLALELSDVYVNYFHAREFGFTWPLSGFIARSVCFGLALFVGRRVAREKSWLSLLNGSLVSAIIFYLITNTQSWAADSFYPKSLAGWWQALTVGHPEYPPTVLFFRNTLFGDLTFTGIFGGAMEWLAHSRKEPSLLDTEEEQEPKPIEIENEK
jgi:hypothetical protein